MQPIPITDIEIIFPGDVRHLMPAWEKIPAEFKRPSGTKWNKVFSDWFYNGLKEASFAPKDGIDPKIAYRHLRAIMGSFQPKQEHKEAAVAYLLSQWFEDVAYEVARP